MKIYKEAITLNKNSRGCYILDTVKGCPGGSLYSGKGCYGSCYAKNIADRYGFSFEKLIARKFENESRQLWLFGLTDKTHTNKIIREIQCADMPFIRIGEMGDPSVDWEHTINILREISVSKKPIVIVTKHWNTIPDKYLKFLESVCVNTSISALDNEEELEHRLEQYERLKNVCNSVLRVVSCDFNKLHSDGFDRHIIQEQIFKIGKCIDTIFRPSNKNIFLDKKIINAKKIKFLKSTVLASVYNENTYMGVCGKCPDMCGINL
jgi:hypothetical protein